MFKTLELPGGFAPLPGLCPAPTGGLKRPPDPSPNNFAPTIFNSWLRPCFDTIIQKLTNPPIRAYADFSQPFVLNVDANLDGLGTVLYQEQGGIELVIAYASRGLRTSDKHYPAY